MVHRHVRAGRQLVRWMLCDTGPGLCWRSDPVEFSIQAVLGYQLCVLLKDKISWL